MLWTHWGQNPQFTDIWKLKRISEHPPQTAPHVHPICHLHTAVQVPSLGKVWGPQPAPYPLSIMFLIIYFLDLIFMWFFSGNRLGEMPMYNQLSWNICFVKKNMPKCMNLVSCDFWGIIKKYLWCALSFLRFSLSVRASSKRHAHASFFQVPEAVGTGTLFLLSQFKIMHILLDQGLANLWIFSVS